MKEVSAGFLDGPFLESDITEGLGVRTGQCPNGSFFCKVKTLNLE